MAVKFLNNIDVSGEVEGTSLDINGNADISGTLDTHGKVTIAAAPTTTALLTLRNTGTGATNDIYMGFNRDNSTGSDGWSIGIDSTANSFNITEDADTIDNSPH